MKSEIVSGSKRTEAGVVPEDWACVDLRDHNVKVGSGITPTGGSRVYQEQGRSFVRSQNVGWGKLILSDLAHITEEIHETFSQTEIKLNDILLNITGASIGRAALADSRVIGGNVNQHVCIIRPSKHSLDAGFLMNFLLSNSGQRQIDSFQAGGNRQGLNFEQIRSFKVPLPPTVDEQYAIAQALGDADALICGLEALIAKKRDIKLGAMQELLTGQRRLPGFKGEWEKVSIASAAAHSPNAIVGGPFGSDLVSADYQAAGVPVIRGQNMGGKYVGGAFVYVSEAKAKDLAANCAVPSDLIFTQRGTLGQVALVPGNGRTRYLVSQSQMKISVDVGRYDPAYFYYYFTSPAGQRQIVDSAIQTGVPHTNLGILKKYRLPVPTDKIEQLAIATILSDLDAEIAALDAKLAKVRAVRQGMMQVLLTGEIRLI